MKIEETFKAILAREVSAEKKEQVNPLIDFISDREKNNQSVKLNFICTHNSRRSHLSQIWAQIAAFYYHVNNVGCYSGGTEATAIFPMIIKTLSHQGLQVHSLSEGENPVVSFGLDPLPLPIIGFSKVYDHPSNPTSEFAAIMTCDSADQNCPYIPGATVRIPVTFLDPKASDGTPAQAQVYADRSIEIAAVMFYVFKEVQCRI